MNFVPNFKNKGHKWLDFKACNLKEAILKPTSSISFPQKSLRGSWVKAKAQGEEKGGFRATKRFPSWPWKDE